MTTSIFHPEHEHHYSGRACVRCGHELTDAASMEVGVGPICRKLDNALLAQMFPANIEAAKSAIVGFNLHEIEESTHETYLKVLGAIASPDAKAVTDWRETVKRIEWILSHGTTSENRSKLTNVVNALGYVGLAALWNGDAATGLATVWFDAGSLYLVGPKNAAGRVAMKDIGAKGCSPKHDGSDIKFAWSVPAAKVNEFFRAVVTHWPHNEGMIEAAGLAKAWKEPVKAAAAKPAAPAAPSAKVIVTAEVVKVKAPYNGAFIGAIKKLPYGKRAWNPVEKVWEAKLECRSAVEALVASHYGSFETVNAVA